MKNAVTLAVALLGTAWLAVASAHHSFATFDTHVTKTLVGTVKQMQWTNPHIWVQLLVKDPASGAMQEWSIEGGSPNGLHRRGWKRTSIKAGDTVEMTIHPLKNGARGGSMMNVTVNGVPVGRRL